MNSDKPLVLKHTDWAQDYVAFAKLTPLQQRHMLRKMQQTIPLAKMTYAQAKLFHRLKGRINGR